MVCSKDEFLHYILDLFFYVFIIKIVKIQAQYFFKSDINSVDANFPDYYKFWPNEEGVYDDRVLVRVVPDTTMTYTGFTERLFTVGPLKVCT